MKDTFKRMTVQELKAALPPAGILRLRPDSRRAVYEAEWLNVDVVAYFDETETIKFVDRVQVPSDITFVD